MGGAIRAFMTQAYVSQRFTAFGWIDQWWLVSENGDTDLSLYPAPAYRSRRETISPGLACRFSLDFWKIGTPSRRTSNLPPRDGISSTSTDGNRSLSSAARLAARGS